MAIPNDPHEIMRLQQAQHRMMEMARAQQNVAMQPGVQEQLSQQNFAGLQGIPQGLLGALSGNLAAGVQPGVSPGGWDFINSEHQREAHSPRVPTTTREKLQAWVNEWIEGIEITRGSKRV